MAGSFRILDIRPGNLEDCPHTHPARPPIERIAAGIIQENCLHAESGGRAKNRSHVCRVGHIFKHCYAALPQADRFHCRELGPFKACQDTARHGNIGQFPDRIRSADKDRYVAEAFKDFGCFALRLRPFYEGSHRNTACTERPFCYLRTLSDEEASVRLIIVPKLVLVQACKDIEPRIVKICEFRIYWHTFSPEYLSFYVRGYRDIADDMKKDISSV